MSSVHPWTFLSSIAIACTVGEICSIVGTLHCRSITVSLCTSILKRVDSWTNLAQSDCDCNGGENCSKVWSVHCGSGLDLSPLHSVTRRTWLEWVKDWLNGTCPHCVHDWFEWSEPDDIQPIHTVQSSALVVERRQWWCCGECGRCGKSKLHWNSMAMSIELLEHHYCSKHLHLPSADDLSILSSIEILWCEGKNWMVVATDPTHPDRIECSTVPPESIDKKMSWMQRRDYMATVNPMGNCVYVCSHHSNGHLATSKMNDGMKSYDTGAILTQNACDLYGRENCTGIRTVRNIIVVMWTRVIDPIPRGQHNNQLISKGHNMQALMGLAKDSRDLLGMSKVHPSRSCHEGRRV